MCGRHCWLVQQATADYGWKTRRWSSLMGRKCLRLAVQRVICDSTAVAASSRWRFISAVPTGRKTDRNIRSCPSDKSLGYCQSSLRDEIMAMETVNPTMNRWAIVKRPSGSKSSRFPKRRDRQMWVGPVCRTGPSAAEPSRNRSAQQARCACPTGPARQTEPTSGVAGGGRLA